MEGVNPGFLTQIKDTLCVMQMLLLFSFVPDFLSIIAYIRKD